MAGLTDPARPGTPPGGGAGPARVLLVDDDPLVRAGLRMILGGAGDLTVVGEAADGLDAERLVGTLHPDIVLMDIRMPVRDGIEATAAIRARSAAPHVLVLTTFDADESVLAALRCGAGGFLLKDTPPDQIVEAVRRVLAGEPTLSPSVLARVISAATGPGGGRRSAAAEALGRLTERERDVAVAVGRGLSNAEIAGELYLSVATVKTHVTHLFDKLGVDNRVQIALCVHDAGMV